MRIEFTWGNGNTFNTILGSWLYEPHKRKGKHFEVGLDIRDMYTEGNSLNSNAQKTLLNILKEIVYDAELAYGLKRQVVSRQGLYRNEQLRHRQAAYEAKYGHL